MRFIYKISKIKKDKSKMMGNSSLRLEHKQENNIKIDTKYIVLDIVDWTQAILNFEGSNILKSFLNNCWVFSFATGRSLNFILFSIKTSMIFQ
jgi:hypothetical protein